MKKIIYHIAFSIIIGILGLVLHYGGLILITFIALFLIYLFFASIVSSVKYLLKKRFINKKNFTLPLFTILLLSIFYIALIFSSPHPTQPSDNRSLNTSDQLKYMVKTDQKDRGTLYFLFNPDRDKQRIEKVYKIIELTKNLSPLDKFNAAIILQHGSLEKDFQTAYNLSKSAFDEGFKKAEWLSKATYDRWQVSKGKPQKYNTQTNIKF